MTDKIKNTEELEALYGKPAEASLLKEVNYIHPLYRPYIESSPFLAVATCGSDGMDVSPPGGCTGIFSD